ncbi:hypothetical protein M231_05564 [Tremella mesenterica]|uniref:BTB domain-containing protein n=1 Tax=Tremella mesenterica TaxID=5217 RepID=A0A4Q1BHU1_TREME|nr:hypothetical protein M231_05564 [Tremella mesenterica]
MSERTGTPMTLEDFLNLKVALKPTDGEAMDVKLHVLFTHSTFFEGLFSISDKGLDQADEPPIELEVTRALLEVMVDQMGGGKTWLKAGAEEIFAGITFCDKYEFETLLEIFLAHLFEHVAHNPWQVFTWASSYDRPGLAAAAIRVFHKHHRCCDFRLLHFPSEFLIDVNPRYMAALIRAMYTCSVSLPNYNQRLKEKEWETVSVHFLSALTYT